MWSVVLLLAVAYLFIRFSLFLYSLVNPDCGKPLSAEEKDKYLRIPNAPGEEFFGGHAHITMKGVEELVRAELERAPISRTRWLNISMLAVRTAKGMSELLSNKATIRAGFAHDAEVDMLGPTMFAIEGDQWKSHRVALAGPFNGAALESLIPAIVERAQALVDAWRRRPSRVVRIDKEMVGLTVDVILTRILGRHLDATDKDPHGIIAMYSSVAGELALRILLPSLSWFPFPSRVAFWLRRWRMRRLLEKFIYDARREGRWKTRPETALEHMLARGFPDREIRDELLGLMHITSVLQGHDTTAHLISFALYHISRDPVIEARVLEEIRRELPPGTVPSRAAAAGLTYLTQVLKETLRLYPPARGMLRRCNEEITIEGYTVPAGVNIFVDLHAAHMDPNYWPDPWKFDPERFAPEREASIVPFSYLPFGAAPHLCLGMDLARLEAKLVLATILPIFRFSLAPGYTFGTQTLPLIHPKDHLPMIWEERNAGERTGR